MKWPWISRRAFDLVCEERDRLRVQVDSLLDHTKRMDRNEHGLHEIPREQKPPLDPAPPELSEYIKGFAFKGFRQRMWKNAISRRARGESWAEIMASIKRERDGDEPEQEEDG